MVKSPRAFDSHTNLAVFEGKHVWTIRNWKAWLGCSESRSKCEAAIYSEKFGIPIVNEDGEEEMTWWQIKAYPKKNDLNNKNMLAFRLISHNTQTPKGSFYFETITNTFLGFHTWISKFKPLPLDGAYHWMTCITHYPHKDLKLKVKLRIVTPCSLKLKKVGKAAKRNSKIAQKFGIQLFQ